MYLWLKFMNRSSGRVKESAVRKPGGRMLQAEGRTAASPDEGGLGISGGGKKEERGLKLGWSGMWEGKPHRQDLACDPTRSRAHAQRALAEQ